MTNDRDLTPRQIPPEASKAAWLLLRSSRSAALATVVEEQPHTALVTPACGPDGSVLLLLSGLSRHTADLRANPRCSLLCIGAQPMASPNPQIAPRLSLSCTAEIEPSAALKARFLAVHPYASLYAGFGDFGLWQLSIRDVHFVGGFAQAWSAEADGFLSPEPAVAAIAAAEVRVLAHCNDDHAEAIALVGEAHGGIAGPWRLSAVDVDGCNLILGEVGIYVAWPMPVFDADSLRSAIIALVDEARIKCRKG